MTSRERVIASLELKQPDRVPLFEIWIENDMVEALGYKDLQSAYSNLGLDCMYIPYKDPFGGADGPDEWGRVWERGQYVDGAIHSEEDIPNYSPPLDHVKDFFNPEEAEQTKKRYPDHCFIFGSHIAPFTATYMAMGLERFFINMIEKPVFVRKLLEDRTEWCIAMFKEAQRHGIDVAILGEDAGTKSGPMISTDMWREFIFPLHCRIVDELDVPVIWHSDGNFSSYLPMAIEAGFVGIHSLEPDVGMDLPQVKQDYGDKLALIGNVDTRVLFGSNLESVRSEVDRCMDQGAAGGGYLFASCNSIFKGMNPDAVREMYRYAHEIGSY